MFLPNSVDRKTARVGTIEPQFEAATNFDQDGFARVWSSNADPNKRRCYLIDQHGRRILAPEYEGIFGFHNGLAIVRVTTKYGTLRYGIIDKNSNSVLQPAWMKLEFLCRKIYVAQRNSGDPFTAITADGSTLFEFSPETSRSQVSPPVVSKLGM